MHPALRPLLAASLLIAACDSPSGSRAEPEPATPLDWVEENAHEVRSISVDAGDDFSDLEPLREAIGNARVVMLGEQTHGDGTTFLAKARLIAFLHREMGFDVLAWESGIYDVDRVWQQIQAGEDVRTATRRGIFGVWGRSEQVRPTLDYVASTVGTPRPLEMAGFDLQLTTRPESDSLAIHIARFAAEISSSVLNDPAWPQALETLRVLASASQTTPPPTQTRNDLTRILTDLSDDAAAAGGQRALWWAQVSKSISWAAALAWIDPGDLQAGGALREAQMSDNLVWLANEHYRGRKIIVWAATAHIARNLEVLTRLDGSPYIGGGFTLKPMGGQVRARLGAGDVYALGFTAARGRYGRGGTSTTLMPPLAESLEAHLDELGMNYAFVDFQDAGPGGEWLASSLSRPFGYLYLRGDWPQVLDGMFYTREMTTSDLAS